MIDDGETRDAGVRRLLAAHRAATRDPTNRRGAADPDELRFVDAMIELLASPSDPFARHHFVPGHFTASAFVTRENGAGGVSVLLVHHGKLDRWLQPGGHFEPDDPDLFAAARREVAEETGLTDVVLADGPRLLDVDVHEIPPLKGDPPHRHYDLRVHLRARPGADAVAGSDAKAVRWVALADDAGFAGSDASVMRAVRRLRRTPG